MLKFEQKVKFVHFSIARVLHIDILDDLAAIYRTTVNTSRSRPRRLVGSNGSPDRAAAKSNLVFMGSSVRVNRLCEIATDLS